MTHQHLFDFDRADLLATDINHELDSASDEQPPLLVELAQISGQKKTVSQWQIFLAEVVTEH